MSGSVSEHSSEIERTDNTFTPLSTAASVTLHVSISTTSAPVSSNSFFFSLGLHMNLFSVSIPPFLKSYPQFGTSLSRFLFSFFFRLKTHSPITISPILRLGLSAPPNPADKIKLGLNLSMINLVPFRAFLIPTPVIPRMTGFLQSLPDIYVISSHTPSSVLEKLGFISLISSQVEQMIAINLEIHLCLGF